MHLKHKAPDSSFESKTETQKTLHVSVWKVSVCFAKDRQTGYDVRVTDSIINKEVKASAAIQSRMDCLTAIGNVKYSIMFCCLLIPD